MSNSTLSCCHLTQLPRLGGRVSQAKPGAGSLVGTLEVAGDREAGQLPCPAPAWSSSPRNTVAREGPEEPCLKQGLAGEEASSASWTGPEEGWENRWHLLSTPGHPTVAHAAWHSGPGSPRGRPQRGVTWLDGMETSSSSIPHSPFTPCTNMKSRMTCPAPFPCHAFAQAVSLALSSFPAQGHLGLAR